MNHEFKFDRSSFKWDEKDYECNLWCAKHTIRMLMEMLRIRGYMYLNQVYEHFSIKWNPENENVLIRYHECYTDKAPLFYFDEDENKDCVHIMIDAYREEDS